MSDGAVITTQALLLITLASALVCGTAGAFAVSQSKTISEHNKLSHTDRNAKNKPEPNFHIVLERVGKTVLRPGSSHATKKLHEQANISKKDAVLELSAGLGTSSMMLAKKYGCRVTITDIDASRLEKAEALAKRSGLDALTTVQKVDMFNIDSGLGSDARFNVAQTEASLTHFPKSRKKQFFEGVSRHADKFLLHEVCFKTDSISAQNMAKKDMSKVLNIGFIPETKESWLELLKDSGFDNITFLEVGDLAVLNPLSLIQDEGLFGFARIVSNVITQPYLRQRMLATRRTIAKHKDDLGYICIVASKK